MLPLLRLVTLFLQPGATIVTFLEVFNGKRFHVNERQSGKTAKDKSVSDPTHPLYPNVLLHNCCKLFHR
jgi:hypothetical protein